MKHSKSRFIGILIGVGIPLSQGESVYLFLRIHYSSDYDTNGTPVRQFNLGYQSAGYYADRSKAAYWDGRNNSGESGSSGVYFYQLRAGDYTALRRMVILK